MSNFRLPRKNQHWVYFYHLNGRAIWPSPGSFRVKLIAYPVTFFMLVCPVFQSVVEVTTDTKVAIVSTDILVTTDTLFPTSAGPAVCQVSSGGHY